MRNITKDLFIVISAIVLTASTVYTLELPKTVMASENKASKSVPKQLKNKVEQEPVLIAKTSPELLQEAPIEPSAPTQAPVVVDNETIVWGFLLSQGFSREQTAGIMGNLQQEHNFRTDGDGLAQWTDNRKAALMALPNNQDITVQVNFLMSELNTYELNTKAAILASTTVEQAAQIFQDKFERCNPYYCHLEQRINYAYQILARH